VDELLALRVLLFDLDAIFTVCGSRGRGQEVGKHAVKSPN
jgi:hypothetical protein